METHWASSNDRSHGVQTGESSITFIKQKEVERIKKYNVVVCEGTAPRGAASRVV